MYAAVLVVLIIFFATTGINLLIKGTLFLSNLTGRNKNEQTTSNTDIIGQPQFIDLPDATNSATLVLKGQATQKMNLKIFVNDDPQKDLFLDTDQFETEVTLQKGENTIYAIIEDPKTKSRVKSETSTVFYSSDKLTLDILSPSDGSKTDKEEIDIVGQTTKEALVRVNDQPTVVGSDGKFHETVRLVPGDNKITISAQDRAGNAETKEIMVTYEKD